ncbi:hypothetical protein FRC14_003194 [Serendipita sp. 396]|nr:hypothetical protein FRC14_003194 [Serendipita sp. 396]
MSHSSQPNLYSISQTTRSVSDNTPFPPIIQPTICPFLMGLSISFFLLLEILCTILFSFSLLLASDRLISPARSLALSIRIVSPRSHSCHPVPSRVFLSFSHPFSNSYWGEGHVICHVTRVPYLLPVQPRFIGTPSRNRKESIESNRNLNSSHFFSLSALSSLSYLNHDVPISLIHPSILYRLSSTWMRLVEDILFETDTRNSISFRL